MRSMKISPENAGVAKYVDCYWLLEKTINDSSPNFPKLNPDPAAHLILSHPTQYYQYEQIAMQAKGQGSHLILPHRKTLVMDHSHAFLVIGIKFHVGALYSLSFLFGQTGLDEVIGLDINELFGLEMEALTPLLSQPKVLRDALDECLISYLDKSDEDKHSGLIQKMLPILAKTPLSEVGVVMGCAQRTIERSFLRVTGLTLKQYQSMNRLEDVLNYLHGLKDASINWSDCAARFGFSDQPHLIRYLKSEIGSTPGNYIKQRDLAIDAYGNFE